MDGYPTAISPYLPPGFLVAGCDASDWQDTPLNDIVFIVFHRGDSIGVVVIIQG